MSKNSINNLPAGLPPLPPVPDGFDRWEYRGVAWCPGGPRKFAYWPSRLAGGWMNISGEGIPQGTEGMHYLEAVRAEPEACKTCKGHGFLPGWTPTYSNPDNQGGAPDTVECPDCQPAQLSTNLSEPQIESSPTPEYAPCGGCGATHPSDRCIGCRHDFEMGRAEPEAPSAEIVSPLRGNSVESVRQQWSHTTVAGHPGYEQLLDKADDLERERDALKAERDRLREALQKFLGRCRLGEAGKGMFVPNDELRELGQALAGVCAEPPVDVPRLLALLKRARHFSGGMNMAAYEAIQESINLLESP